MQVLCGPCLATLNNTIGLNGMPVLLLRRLQPQYELLGLLVLQVLLVTLRLLLEMDMCFVPGHLGSLGKAGTEGLHVTVPHKIHAACPWG